MEYLIGFLLLILISLIFGLRNLLKKVEIYEDKVREYESIIIDQQEYVKRVSEIIVESKQYVNQIDEKGIFQSDDEVGTFFRFLKDIQETLSNFIITEINGTNQK